MKREIGRGKKDPTGRGRKVRSGEFDGILGLSGGPDSTYLFLKTAKKSKKLLAAHVDHGLRGSESREDRLFVRNMAARIGAPIRCKVLKPSGAHPAKDGKGGSAGKRPFQKPLGEDLARRGRYQFFRALMKETGAETLILAHTADDQVETVLMRILKGAGIAGLKGIPRKSKDGIERPILHMWKEDILKYLREHNIHFRTDETNLDTRFERNWIRHVLIPLLEKRYGKSVKKRIFAVGERLREIDRFLEATARKWIGRNLRAETSGGGTEALVIRRKTFRGLPSELRIRILQLICFEKAGVTPNERLLASMDRLVLSGAPSATLDIGKGATLSLRYEFARLTLPKMDRKKRSWKPVLIRGEGTHEASTVWIHWKESGGKISASAIRKRTAGERTALFDGEEVQLPLTARPLRHGDRVRPFGMEEEKKVKEILIDRKIDRNERWGRPVVCDAEGTILWIPGILRSAHAPVTRRTRRMIQLGISDRTS